MHLFKKDKFSIGEPSFLKLNDFDKREVNSIIQKYYTNFIVVDVYQVGAFEINSNNWKIQTKEGDYLLKKVKIDKLISLSVQVEFANQLVEKLFPTISFVENIDRELISRDENFIYCITNFVDGEYFGSSLEEWPELLKYLRKLYEYSLQQDKLAQLNFPLRTFFTEKELILVEKLKLSPECVDLPQLQIDKVIYEYEKSRIVFYSEKEKFNKVVYHVDIHPHNLIFKKNKLLLFIDFESFQTTLLEVSLGFGLYKCLRQLLSNYENLSEQKLCETVRYFKTEFSKQFPDSDFKKLLIYGKMDVIKRILYILNELSELGGSKWLFILNTQLCALDEINELERALDLIENKK